MSRELAYEVLGHLASYLRAWRCPSTSLFVSKKYCHASFDTEGVLILSRWCALAEQHRIVPGHVQVLTGVSSSPYPRAV